MLAATGCQLAAAGDTIKYVTYIQFDYTHFRRDNPNFPSYLENTAIDIPTVFGAGSPEADEVALHPAQAFADFVGIGVHCAHDSTLCTDANHARPDLLPDEPNGYENFKGLFGAKYVDPLI